MLTLPKPPSFLLVFVHASRLYSESVEAKTTCVLREANCEAASEKATISVGHTNVQAIGMKHRNSHLFCDVYVVRDSSAGTY